MQDFLSKFIEETRRKEVVGTKEIPTRYKECINANIIAVKAGTTGYKGGDSGHGGGTVFKLKDLSSTDLNVSINGSGYFPANEFGIALGGDAELDTFIEALEFALNTLKEQAQRK